MELVVIVNLLDKLLRLHRDLTSPTLAWLRMPPRLQLEWSFTQNARPSRLTGGWHKRCAVCRNRLQALMFFPSPHRSRIAIVGGPSRGSLSTYTRTPSYGGSGTPMYGSSTPGGSTSGHGGRTPMYGSQTPMYQDGSRTPHYGGMTPSHGNYLLKI